MATAVEVLIFPVENETWPKARPKGATPNLSSRFFLEEAGSANSVISLSGNRHITPKSDAILPSITRRSVMQIAKDELGMELEERPIHLLNESSTFEEMGACGTAAVISLVQSILYKNERMHMKNSREGVGPVMQKLYSSLT